MTRENLAEADPEEADANGEVDGEAELEAEAEREAEAEEDPRDSSSADPVGAYLRGMTAFSLLTREGEVELAKRIEDGQRRVLQIVLDSLVGIDELLSLGDELPQDEARVEDVVMDVDTADPDFDERRHAERVCKVFDK